MPPTAIFLSSQMASLSLNALSSSVGVTYFGAPLLMTMMLTDYGDTAQVSLICLIVLYIYIYFQWLNSLLHFVINMDASGMTPSSVSAIKSGYPS